MSCHHTNVNFKFQPIKKKDGTGTAPISLFTGHTLPCCGHPSQGHGTKHSTHTWYNYALAKPGIYIGTKLQKTLCVCF
jgi:hypothetical protein